MAKRIVMITLELAGRSVPAVRAVGASTAVFRSQTMTPGGCILLVEDDPAMAEMYRRRLERDGYQVTVARDGEMALRLATTLDHDLLLVDIGLPYRSGLEVMRMLRENPRTSRLPMAVLSNYNEPSMVSEAEGLGALAYMVKADVTPTSLAKAVSGWLRG